MMKNIAFVTHSFHKKSQSVNILADALFDKALFNITYFYIDDWTQHTQGLKEDVVGYDMVLIIQLFSVQLLSKIKCDNIVFMPMYDFSYAWKAYKWLECVNVKILSPIKKMHDQLCQLGLNSYYFKYYPEPDTFTPGDLKRVFLWQRINPININTTLQLLQPLSLEQIHLHRAVDPGHTFCEPSQEAITQYGITFSDWFTDKNDYFQLLQSFGLYMAPRLMEGGGAAFTDAVRMGKVVIAHQDAAMDEYITHGETGLLYDAHEIKPLNLDTIDLLQIQKNAYQSVQEGYKNFQKARQDLWDFIDSPPQPLLSIPVLNTIQQAGMTLQQKEERLKHTEMLLAHDKWYCFGQLSRKEKIKKIFKMIVRFFSLPRSTPSPREKLE